MDPQEKLDKLERALQRANEEREKADKDRLKIRKGVELARVTVRELLGEWRTQPGGPTKDMKVCMFCFKTPITHHVVDDRDVLIFTLCQECKDLDPEECLPNPTE